MRVLPVLLLLLAPLAAGAAPAPSAAKRSERVVAAFQEVKSGAGAAANAEAFAALDSFLDFEAIASAAIELRKEKFTPAQRAAFGAGFREVVRLAAYPDSGAFFRKAKLAWAAPVEGPGGVTVVSVDAKLPSEGLETRIGLHWKASGGDLRVVDVSFDGDSLVRDYQNQFARIVDKEGVPALLERLRERKAQLEAGAAKP